LSKQSDHENASCTSFHSGKSHSAWLEVQCGGCEQNHPWWTHGEWHHAYKNLPPENCAEVHPAHSHDEFEHKGIACVEFHPDSDHDDWELGNGLRTAEEAEDEHERTPCDSFHPEATHVEWEDHPGSTCDSIHSEETHTEWIDAKDHPGSTCDEEHWMEEHDNWAYQKSLSPRELRSQEREQKELVRHTEEMRKERNEKDTYKFILILIAIAVLGVIINALHPPLEF